METPEPTEPGPQLNNCCFQASESSHEPPRGGWGVQLPPIPSSCTFPSLSSPNPAVWEVLRGWHSPWNLAKQGLSLAYPEQ